MKTYIVDAFTTEPFKGNPAGICFPDRQISDLEMLNVAKELGFSETAFVTARNGENNTYDIRFWTPQSEIPLCGHATLGSAKVILSNTDADRIRLINIQNIQLDITRADDQVAMEFPVYDVVPAEVPLAMLDALGISEIENCVYNAETRILVLEIRSAKALAALRPDYAALLKTHNNIDGVLVTARGDDEKFDFHSRYFWPWKGTNEDPVTGASHTFLAKYWSQKLDKLQMRSFQASERSGWMNLELRGDKLLIRGHAVILLEGKLFV
jgi:PhzF family phenazine biosynthesis protein